jgi:hypothetical protein
MVDHRRTPSQRAYRLPGWFFVLTGVLSVVGIAAAGWVLVGEPFPSSKVQPTAAPRPTPTTEPTSTPKPTASADHRRDGIKVLVLNATRKPGLAAGVADKAKKAGWKVADIGNWPYPAAQNAVFYPDGHEAEGALLGEDLSIKSVRPNRPGMSTDQLTVILLYTP